MGKRPGAPVDPLPLIRSEPHGSVPGGCLRSRTPIGFHAGFRRVIIPSAFGTLSGCDGEPQTLTVTATAYNSVPGQTQGDPNVGAWGDEIRPGDRVIAVSPDLVSLGLDHGTKVRIEGLRGTYRVADRTHSRLERTIDIYMGTDVEKAREWGKQQVEIRWWN